MRILRLLLVPACLALGVAACNRGPEPQPPPPVRPVATMKDIMDSMLDPSADILWESVETVISANGIEERQPRTEEEWLNVRRHAVIVLEASNLLLMEGRRVAGPNDKAAAPGIELEPHEIEERINSDRQAFVNHALALHDAALPVFNAVEARNPQALTEAGLLLDQACENCHKQYWYPNAPSPLDLPPVSQ
jgi:hypothetical protein